jgi:signal transduction histidine kinase
MQKKAYEDLVAEVQELRIQMEEAQETLNAIRRGEVDGLVVSTQKGEQVYTISGAERPYRVLIEEMREGAVMLSSDNTILYCNSGFAKMLNKPIDKIVGRYIQNMVLSTHMTDFEELLTDGRNCKGVMVKEITLQANGDKPVPTLMSINAFKMDNIETTFVVATDLTKHMEEDLKRYTSNLEREILERKKAEHKLEEYQKNLEKIVEERTKQLQDSERLAAIGATAGMVGHDIRNPLQAITSDVYLAKTELDSIPESDAKKSVLESLQEIEKNTEYINKIVADLQDFARPLKPNAEETDLKLIIEELLKKNGLPENIKVSVKVEPDARNVVADRTFINRIMYNLINNAVQAMPNGGKLTIHSFKEANDVLISVKDTGVGIPETVRGKLFTPMFTTKAKGQGFGLAVVKRMTESLGGTVTFESQEGKGTTFIVRLPQSPQQKI